MSGILAIRDNIRDFVRKYGEIVIPIIRFIVAIIVFNSINSMFGYSTLFDKKPVVYLLSIICALVADPVAILIAGTVVLVNAMTVSIEIGALFLVLFVLMYTLYMRMFRECCYVLAIVPVLLLWKATYLIPFVVVMLAGVTGIVPAGFGVIIFYFAKHVKEAKAILDVSTEEDDFQAYSYVVDHLIENKEMLAIIIALTMVMVITYVIYRLPFDFSWYVAIAVGAISNIIFNAAVGASLGAEASMGSVVLQSFIGIIIALFIIFWKGILEYSKKEVVQFEDDEYYYYVKAIPKLGAAERMAKQTAENAKAASSKKTAANKKSATNTKASADRPVNRTSVAQPASNTKNNTVRTQAKPEMKRDYVSEAIRENINVSRNNRNL